MELNTGFHDQAKRQLLFFSCILLIFRDLTYHCRPSSKGLKSKIHISSSLNIDMHAIVPKILRIYMVMNDQVEYTKQYKLSKQL